MKILEFLLLLEMITRRQILMRWGGSSRQNHGMHVSTSWFTLHLVHLIQLRTMCTPNKIGCSRMCQSLIQSWRRVFERPTAWILLLMCSTNKVSKLLWRLLHWQSSLGFCIFTHYIIDNIMLVIRRIRNGRTVHLKINLGFGIRIQINISAVVESCRWIAVMVEISVVTMAMWLLGPLLYRFDWSSPWISVHDILTSSRSSLLISWIHLAQICQHMLLMGQRVLSLIASRINHHINWIASSELRHLLTTSWSHI